MLRYISLFLFLAFRTFILANEGIRLKPKELWVYQGRAIIEKVAEFKIKKGSNKIRLFPIENSYIDNSLSLSIFPKDINIEDVRIQKGFIFFPKDNTPIVKQIERLKKVIKGYEDDLSILKKRKDFVYFLYTKRSKQPLKDLVKGYEFATIELKNILTEERSLKEKIKKLRDKLKVLSSMVDLSEDRIKRSKVVILTLNAHRGGVVSVKIRYALEGVYWTPSYKVNYSSSENKIHWKYMANVYQNTICNWKSVRLNILTGTPSFFIHPSDNPIWEFYYEERYYEKFSKAGRVYALPPTFERMEKKKRGKKSRIIYRDIGAFFKLEGVYDVLNRNRINKVFLKELVFSPNSKYAYVVPALSNKVYFMVEGTIKSKVPIIKGDILLFFDGLYRGKSTLSKDLFFEDRYKLSFGFYEGIKVKRELVFNKRGTIGFLSKKRYVEKEYRITIENKENKYITIYIKEPLPYSNYEDINIDILKVFPKPYKIDRFNVYIWKLKLSPFKKVVLNYRFRVSYPKDYILYDTIKERKSGN